MPHLNPFLAITVSNCPEIKKRIILAVEFHLVSSLLAVVDFLEGDCAWGKEVSQFGQIDTIPETFLQLCGGRQLLIQTGLHPPRNNEQKIDPSLEDAHITGYTVAAHHFETVTFSLLL